MGLRDDYVAANMVNLEMVKYCVAKKCPIDGACAECCRKRSSRRLKYLREEAKAPWDYWSVYTRTRTTNPNVYNTSSTTTVLSHPVGHTNVENCPNHPHHQLNTQIHFKAHIFVRNIYTYILLNTPAMCSHSPFFLTNSRRMKGLTYTIADKLYVSLTNECQKNLVKTLMETRGPQFKFSLPKLERNPSVEEVCVAIDAHYSRAKIVGMGENDSGVTFAGIGDPLTRLDALEHIVHKIREKRHGVVLRVMTNGLYDVQTARRAADLKLETYTVSLTSGEPEQWKRLTLRDDVNDDADFFSLSDWCAFVDALAQSGRKVEVTTPVAPGVDVNLARELAMSLGAVEFRTREYFP